MKGLHLQMYACSSVSDCPEPVAFEASKNGWNGTKMPMSTKIREFYHDFWLPSGIWAWQACMHIEKQDLSFDLVGQMWKSDKNWIQKWAKSDATPNSDMIMWQYH